MIDLEAFNVLKKLAVKDIRVGPKKVSAVYSAENFAGELQSSELIYSYEEKVFDPSEPESQNLADMIAAQVAVNYGLFCRSIVLPAVIGGSVVCCQRQSVRAAFTKSPSCLSWIPCLSSLCFLCSH